MLLKISLRVESDEGQNRHPGAPPDYAQRGLGIVLNLLKCHTIGETFSDLPI